MWRRNVRRMADAGLELSARLRQALEVLTRWLHAGRGCGGQGFEQLCAEHPDLGSELQALHSLLRLAQTAASSRNFQQRFEFSLAMMRR
jgi:hypothetical protein